MSPRPPFPTASRPLIWSVLLLSSLLVPSRAEPTADRAALLSFLSSTRHDPRRVTWDAAAAANTSACLWRGVTCDAAQAAVVALRLPGTGLSGPVPPSTPLARLASLRYLSLRSNALSGPLPEVLLGGGNGTALTRLKGLYLQRNRFSGPIPPGVARMRGILRLDLSGNELTGGIPEGLGGLAGLTGLFLQGNRLSGEIPEALGDLTALQGFNVSNNQLRGPIPDRLGRRFPASAFAGNVGLCGAPLPPCAPAQGPSAAPNGDSGGGSKSNKRKKLSTAAIVAIAAAVGGALLLLAALAVLALCCCCRRRIRGQGTGSPKPAPGAATSTVSAGGADTATTSSTSKEDLGGRGGPARLSGDKRKKLVFLDGTGAEWYTFDLEDLLRASAEVLGKGALGTSYKAVLEDGATVVVKRLRGENAAVGKPEFDACMQAVARAGAGEGHRNVQPLRAYYYSKDEKLLLFDYVPGGSLSATLHANRGSGRTALEWPSRLRIALTAARGLLHLHATANLVHGNLKASNVLLRRDLDGAAAAVLTDYALHPLFGPSAPHIRGGPRASGYRAPERAAGAAPTPDADVYGYGVLVLELLTGRSPGSPGGDQMESVGGGAPADLPRWVRSVVREEWTAEVLDADLVRYGSEEEMVRLLQVALACTEAVPSARPRLEEVARMVEEVAAAAAAAEGEESATGKAAAGLSSSDDRTSGAPTPPTARTP